jgi:hypothetical protein
VEEDVERGGEGEKVLDGGVNRAASVMQEDAGDTAAAAPDTRSESEEARESGGEGGRCRMGMLTAIERPESRAPCSSLGIPSTGWETSFFSPVEWTGSVWFGPC